MNSSSVLRYFDSLKYSLYLIFHPFKGFWNLKYDEKKGSVFAANTLLLLFLITNVLGRQLTSFILNFNNIYELNIINEIFGVFLPFLLWCVANWCTTTLMDGKGRLIDIYIASAYAITPLVIIKVPLIIFSNIITINEAAFYQFILSVSIIWVGFLFFTGIMTVHQFTMGKNIASILITFLVMIVIVVLVILFFALIQQLLNFIILLIKEVQTKL